MLINKSEERVQERSEKATENLIMPIYVSIFIGLVLIEIVSYVLSNWLN